jgi:hypothetical protein
MKAQFQFQSGSSLVADGRILMILRKIIVVGLSVFVSALTAAYAQTGVETGKTNDTQMAFSLAAKKVGSYVTKKRLDCPNHDTRIQSTAIEIKLVNMTSTNESITVEWYFVAKRDDNGRAVLFGNGSKTIELKPGASVTSKETSDKLYLHDPHCVERDPKSDAKMIGYIVKGTASDGNVKFWATQPSLKEVVGSDEAFAKLKKDSEEWQKTRPKRDD